MSQDFLSNPANDSIELDPLERDVIERCGFDPDNPEDVDAFYAWERSLEPDHWRDDEKD